MLKEEKTQTLAVFMLLKLLSFKFTKIFIPLKLNAYLLQQMHFSCWRDFVVCGHCLLFHQSHSHNWIARPRLDCRHSTRLSVSEIFYFVLRDQFLIKIRYNSHRSTSPMPTTICFRATRVSSDYQRQFVFYRVNNTVIRTLCYHWSLVLISDELMLHHPSTFSNSIEETVLV